MTQPFEDIRERLDRAEETEAAFPHEDLDKFVSPGAQQATEDVARLLSAVDALMEVARAVVKLNHGDTEVTYKRLNYAIGALPPELKEALK